MSDYIDRWREPYRPSLPNNELGETPSWFSKESREIALSNKRARVKAIKRLNRARLRDFAEQLEHELKNRERGRRKERAVHVMDLQEEMIEEIYRRSNGNIEVAAELYKTYQIWLGNEHYNLATDG